MRVSTTITALSLVLLNLASVSTAALCTPSTARKVTDQYWTSLATTLVDDYQTGLNIAIAGSKAALDLTSSVKRRTRRAATLDCTTREQCLMQDATVVCFDLTTYVLRDEYGASSNFLSGDYQLPDGTRGNVLTNPGPILAYEAGAAGRRAASGGSSGTSGSSGVTGSGSSSGTSGSSGVTGSGSSSGTSGSSGATGSGSSSGTSGSSGATGSGSSSGASGSTGGVVSGGSGSSTGSNSPVKMGSASINQAGMLRGGLVLVVIVMLTNM